MSIRVTTKGAVANGQAAQRLPGIIAEMNDDMGQLVHNAVKLRLGQVLQNPTGYYESRVVTDVSQGEVSISDSGVIYGPWLEGTSSRNGRSRFKGYATFRKVSQDIENKAADQAERSLGQKLVKLQ